MNNILVTAIAKFADVIYYLVFARVMMSWLIKDRNNQIVLFVNQITEPILAPCRQLLKKFGLGGTIDFSPILALFGIQIIAKVLINIVR